MSGIGGHALPRWHDVSTDRRTTRRIQQHGQEVPVQCIELLPPTFVGRQGLAMKASERVVTRVIEEQARAWLISNRESGQSPESRAEFLAWLQASPMHMCAYLAIAKVAAELQSVSQAFDTPIEQLIEMA